MTTIQQNVEAGDLAGAPRPAARRRRAASGAPVPAQAGDGQDRPGLARRPGTVARRAAGWRVTWRDRGGPFRRSRRRRGTAGSPTRRGRTTRCSGGSSRPTSRPGRRRGLLVEDAYLDWRDAERVGFVVRNLVEAASPSNNPLINPRSVEGGRSTAAGCNVTRGLRKLASDLAAPPRVPSMVAPDAFEVGGDLAVTPGAVVLRTEIFELIQYAPDHRAGEPVPRADRAADDQQVLHPRSGARPQHGRVPGRSRASRCS